MWRQSSRICDRISQRIDGRPRPRSERRTGVTPLGRRRRARAGSPNGPADEERSATSWVDRLGKEKDAALEDILIIAPYNGQVFDLKDRVPSARIGTVDKFQGQEAPIVIYSMTTSTHADAPRGMGFLYSLNRLNVATPRARALSILVCSPALFKPECRTPERMRMANAFCKYLEMAERM
jgi:superfamily I DNA and/or RNA helicase